MSVSDQSGERVEFTPNGIFAYKWDSDVREYVRFRPKKKYIEVYLRRNCEIIEGTTLKQIFQAVDYYPRLKSFISKYSWCRQIDEFHAQGYEPQREPNEKMPIEYLEIYHHPEVRSVSKTVKHPGGLRERTIVVDFDSYVGFHGIGPPPVGEEDNPGYRTPDNKVNYGVSYSPMWQLADLPVKLKKSFDVYEPFDLQKRQKKGLPEKLLASTRDFTFLEVLDAIYWDISFCGGPAENVEFLEELKRRTDEIESGEAELIPLDEVLENLKKGEENL